MAKTNWFVIGSLGFLAPQPPDGAPKLCSALLSKDRPYP